MMSCCHVLVLLPYLLSVGAAPINISLDLAIVIGTQFSGDQLEATTEALLSIPKMFTFGDSLTRVAILARTDTDNSWTVVNDDLSSDVSKYEEALSGIKTVWQAVTDLVSPLTTIRSLFTPLNSRRIKFIFVIIGMQSISSQAIKEAKSLRNSSVLLHVYSVKGNEQQLAEFTGDSDMVKTVDEEQFTDQMGSTVEGLPGLIVDYLCMYNESCFYDNSKPPTCIKDWFTPRSPQNVFDCYIKSRPPAKSGAGCPNEDCDQTCLQLWPPSKWPCNNSTCGRKVPIKRTSQIPWKILQYCPAEMECYCGTITGKNTEKNGQAQRPSTPKIREDPGTMAGIVIVALSAISVMWLAVAVFVVWKGDKWRQKKLNASMEAVSQKSDRKVGSEKEDSKRGSQKDDIKSGSQKMDTKVGSRNVNAEVGGQKVDTKDPEKVSDKANMPGGSGRRR